MTDPKPGQMWVWDKFTVGNGSWIVEYVTSERRVSYAGTSAGGLYRGDVFTIISLDDPGPFMMQSFNIVSDRVVMSKRWHTALLGDRIFWLDHHLLDFSTLVRDAEHREDDDATEH